MNIRILYHALLIFAPMKKTFILLCAIATFTACNNSNDAHKSTELIITPARNYFVLNTYANKALHGVIMHSKQEFDAIIGAAAFMGEQGKPTQVDFTKQASIAVIDNITDSNTVLKITKVVAINDTLNVYYTKTNNTKASYSIRPVDMVVIPSTTMQNIKLVKAE
jgi:hypothetical protein